MIVVKNNAFLHHLNTMRIQAQCDKLIQFDSPAECHRVMELAHGTPLTILGGGSNTIPFGNVTGTVIQFTGKEVKMENGLLRVQAGATLDDIIALGTGSGCEQAASLSLIPGSLGGAAVQNAGAYGAEISNFIHSLRVFDFLTGKEIIMTADQCNYSYRHSWFKDQEKGRYLITEIWLKFDFDPNSVSLAQEKRQSIISQRQNKLPDVEATGSAGSYFKNPIISQQEFERLVQLPDTSDMPHFPQGDGKVKLSAAWFIEHAGYKGVTRGNAATYHRHALIIINATGRASYKEIAALENEIVRGVKEKYGITLQPEVVKIGNKATTHT